MEFYEGIFAVLAGLSLVVAAVLIVRGSLVRAAATAFVGTTAFTFFFWFAAIPADLSDEIFGVLTLPTPTACLIALSALLARRAQDVDPDPARDSRVRHQQHGPM